jgi:hypothetical protein
MIRFSPHAECRMRFYRVTHREVEAAVANPDIQMPGRHGRTIIRTRVRARGLRVVVEPRHQALMIVSVTAIEEGGTP